MKDDLFIHVTRLDLTSKSTDNVEMYDQVGIDPFGLPESILIGTKLASKTAA